LRRIGKVTKMDKKINHEYFRAEGLLPFQAEFALSFLESKDKPYWQLVSPTGTGKTRTSAAIIAYELEAGSNKRILVLTPASLLMQWKSVLSERLSLTEVGCTPFIVDRKTYLEFESRVSVGESPFPLPSVILMSVDLAKRDDMTSKLKETTWDLVIFDESQLLTGRRRSLFNVLTKSGAVRRVLLLTAIERQIHDDVVTKSVRFKDIKAWDGKPLFKSMEKKWLNIYYNRTKEEIKFLDELQKFSSQLADIYSYGRLLETNIFRIASSSIYATERMLRRLLENWKFIRNKIAHGIPWTSGDLETAQQEFIRELDEVEVLEEVSESITIQPEKLINSYQKLEALLNRIEEIQTDSKLNALLSYLKSSLQSKGKPYLCIWTSFRNTAGYLMSSIQDLEIPVYILTGSLNTNEMINNLDLFRNNGGVLISTDVLLEGVRLELVDECINYDLPLNPLNLEQRWGRFLRIDRQSEFRMVVLRDQSKSLLWEEELLSKLEKATVSDEHGPK